MSVVEKVMTTVAKHLPDREADPWIDRHDGCIGRATDRLDGPVKVTGQALFIADHQVEDLVHAALVHAPIARGRIAGMDLSAARAAPGVLLVMTHENVPRMSAPKRMSFGPGNRHCAASELPVMQDDRVAWNGQPVAVVVARTQAQADHAAALVRVRYRPEPADVDFEARRPHARLPEDVLGEPTEVTIGEPARAWPAVAQRIEREYRTPPYHHNAIEPHATIALWHADRLLVLDSTQSLAWSQHTIADAVGLPPGRVRVMAPFVGGGFGGKGMLWSPTLLCVAAAKLCRRPVRLRLTREGVYRSVGSRAASVQQVALGAAADGHLAVLEHAGTTAVVRNTNFPEQFTFPARHLYAAPALHLAQRIAELDMVANTAMRAPGESIGTYALESAMDELSYALDTDPVELRRLNEPSKDPTAGTPFSSRHLVEAYRRGAERFGWAARPRAPASQRDGEWQVGQGVATAYYPFFMLETTARVRLGADGRATVQAAAHEMGMGTATVQAQHAADRLGLPLDRVAFEYGDSDLPRMGTAGGSSQTASLVAAVRAAVDKLHAGLLDLAPRGSPLAGARPADVQARRGGLYRKDDGRGESYAALLARAGRDELVAEAAAPAPREMAKYSMGSFGAQFCEVRVHAVTREIRIARWLGSFDVGRVLNPKTAASQLRGGIVMGIGMALTEHVDVDRRNGRIVNPSLAEYHVPVHRDVPRIEILVNDIPDPHAPLGAHGIGEIGITGAAAAVANAVYHATGRRVRDLPITLDKLL